MTEKSYYWGGLVTGDATLAPYSDDEFSDNDRIWANYDRITNCVLPSYGNRLAATNPSGVIIRIATGAAIVDGKFYVNDAVKDLTLNAAPGSGTDYYSVVLDKDFAAQTVRLGLNGPVNGGPRPAVTQIDGTTWEVELYEVRQTSGGVITIIDRRFFTAQQKVLLGHITEEDQTTSPISFTSIPPIFHELEVHITARSASLAGYLSLQLNGSAAALYDYSLAMFAGAITYNQATLQTSLDFAEVNSSAHRCSGIARILDARSTGRVHVLCQGYDGSNNRSLVGGGFWDGAGPVTQVDILNALLFSEVDCVLYGLT